MVDQVAIIVAMKGHPGTGKTTLARAIAAALKCPLIDKDDVRDSTLSLQEQLPHHHHPLLNDLSYQVIFRIARTQLIHLRLSTIVLDSPLSHPDHLLSLRRLASSAAAHLLIVECRPSDEAEWRRRLENRTLTTLHGDDDASWHKPATWRDLQTLIDGYAGRTDYDVGDVPRLVIDTTASSDTIDDRVSAVVRFIDELRMKPDGGDSQSRSSS